MTALIATVRDKLDAELVRIGGPDLVTAVGDAEVIAGLARALRDLTEISYASEPLAPMPDDVDLAALELMSKVDGMTRGQNMAFSEVMRAYGLMDAWNALDKALEQRGGSPDAS
jgi:hypothetical protein